MSRSDADDIEPCCLEKMRSNNVPSSSLRARWTTSLTVLLLLHFSAKQENGSQSKKQQQAKSSPSTDYLREGSYRSPSPHSGRSPSPSQHSGGRTPLRSGEKKTTSPEQLAEAAADVKDLLGGDTPKYDTNVLYQWVEEKKKTMHPEDLMKVVVQVADKGRQWMEGDRPSNRTQLFRTVANTLQLEKRTVESILRDARGEESKSANQRKSISRNSFPRWSPIPEEDVLVESRLPTVPSRQSEDSAQSDAKIKSSGRLSPGDSLSDSVGAGSSFSEEKYEPQHDGTSTSSIYAEPDEKEYSPDFASAVAKNPELKKHIPDQQLLDYEPYFAPRRDWNLQSLGVEEWDFDIGSHPDSSTDEGITELADEAIHLVNNVDSSLGSSHMSLKRRSTPKDLSDPLQPTNQLDDISALSEGVVTESIQPRIERGQHHVSSPNSVESTGGTSERMSFGLGFPRRSWEMTKAVGRNHKEKLQVAGMLVLVAAIAGGVIFANKKIRRRVPIASSLLTTVEPKKCHLLVDFEKGNLLKVIGKVTSIEAVTVDNLKSILTVTYMERPSVRSSRGKDLFSWMKYKLSLGRLLTRREESLALPANCMAGTHSGFQVAEKNGQVLRLLLDLDLNPGPLTVPRKVLENDVVSSMLEGFDRDPKWRLYSDCAMHITIEEPFSGSPLVQVEAARGRVGFENPELRHLVGELPNECDWREPWKLRLVYKSDISVPLDLLLLMPAADSPLLGAQILERMPGNATLDVAVTEDDMDDFGLSRLFSEDAMHS